MTERGRMRAWVLAAAGLGVAGVGFLGFKTLGPRPGGVGKAGAMAAAVTEKSPLRELSAAIARGDGLALATLKARLEAKPKGQAETSDPAPPAMTEAEGAEWIDALSGLRAGLSRFSAYGRASAVVVASEILRKFESAPAPPTWIGVLAPSAEVLAAGLADEVWEVRVAALNEIKGLWNWTPRRENFHTIEAKSLSMWKGGFHHAVVRRLDDREPKSRGAAVACLGEMPINSGAEPAVARIADPDPGVRLQALISFSQRPALLTEEAILPLLYDPEPFIPKMAERVLKARGLSPDQIGLGKLAVHPRPDMRTTAIPLLKDHPEIDPIVWLVYLSRDPEESVRLKALEALAVRDSSEARTRVAEMAAKDASPAVRARAEELLPPGESTASLPPLPSPSTGLKLKAN